LVKTSIPPKLSFQKLLTESTHFTIHKNYVMKKMCLFLLLVFVISTSYAPPPDKDYTSILINGVACGPHGDAKTTGREYQSNVFKNRFDFPKANEIDGSIDLGKIEKAKEGENGFSPQKAVNVEGYVYDVKVGGTETCNCHAGDPLLKDTHIELIVDPDKDGQEKRVIVEVTPRIRQMMEEQGIDWSTENLKKTMKHQYVRIQGWLFYDVSHDKENFADDPDDNVGRKNWRATSWEVHPVTAIEVEGDDVPESATGTMSNISDDEDNSGFVPGSGKPLVKAMSTTVSKNSNGKNMNTNQTPGDMLILIALGAILGMVGQGIRVLVGLKKMQDVASSTGQSKDELYQVSRVIMSFVIACAIGAIAGIIAALSKIDTVLDKSVLIAFIGAGYAGTDFIEGFLRKEGSVITGGKTPDQQEGVPVKPVTPAPKEKGNSPV
jgi:hypothetical protein